MPAGKRLGPGDTARIRAYLADTNEPLSVGAIADLIGVSKRTIERLKLNFELFDAPYPPPSARVGRPPILTQDQQGFVLEFFTQNPHASLADATAAVWERFDVNLSAKSVGNILYKHRWNRQGKRKSNFQGPDAALHSTDLDENQDRPTDAATQPTATQTLPETSVPARRTRATHVLNEPSPSTWRPIHTQLREESSSSEPPSMVLPEIELPAFALQAADSPTHGYNLTALAAPIERLPCPRCGCASREHQNA